MSDTLRVTFWGVRGSFPVPGQDTVRFGGNTPCVEVQANGHTIIIDAGTGIVRLGNELLRRAKAQQEPVRATLLFSHMHHDHTQGFPFFTPAYVGTSVLNIFGPRVFERDLEETLAHAMLPPNFPITLQEMSSLKILRNMSETHFITLGPDHEVSIHNLFHDEYRPDPGLVQIRAMRSYAHPEDVLVYRIEWAGKTLVYASDTEGYVNTDQRLVQFARDADVLIHDAQYSEDHYMGRLPGIGATQGWGHSTPQMACGVAQAANVKQLVLFHHEPRYADDQVAAMEAEAKAIFPETRSAYEGLTIEL